MTNSIPEGPDATTDAPDNSPGGPAREAARAEDLQQTDVEGRVGQDPEAAENRAQAPDPEDLPDPDAHPVTGPPAEETVRLPRQ